LTWIKHLRCADCRRISIFPGNFSLLRRERQPPYAQFSQTESGPTQTSDEVMCRPPCRLSMGVLGLVG
jgi:hypothetical protein